MNLENTAQAFLSTNSNSAFHSKLPSDKNLWDKGNECCEDYDSDATKSVSDMSTSNQYITSDDEDDYSIPVKYNFNKILEKSDAKNLNISISISSNANNESEKQNFVQSTEDKRKLNPNIQLDNKIHNISPNIAAVSSSAMYISNNKVKPTQNQQPTDVPSGKTHLLSRLSPVFSTLKDENSPIKLVENMVSGLLGTKNSLAEVTTQIMASETEKKKKSDSFIEFVGIKRTFCKAAIFPKSSHNDKKTSGNDSVHNICRKLSASNKQYYNSLHMKNNKFGDKKHRDVDAFKNNDKSSKQFLNNSNLHNITSKTSKNDSSSNNSGTKTLLPETKAKQQHSVSLHYNSIPLQHRQIKTICQATSITEMFSDDEEEENGDCKELNSSIKENDIKIKTKKVETGGNNAVSLKIHETGDYKCDSEKAPEIKASKEVSGLKDDPGEGMYADIKNEKCDTGDFKVQKGNVNDQIDDKKVKDENSKSDSVIKKNDDETIPKLESDPNEVVCMNNIVKKEHEINNENKNQQVPNHEINEVLKNDKINNYKVIKINEKPLKSNPCSSSGVSTLPCVNSARPVCDKNNGLNNSFEEGDDDDSRDTIVQSALEVEEGGKESSKNNEREKKEENPATKKETNHKKSMESHLMMLSQSPATLFIPQATFQHPASANYLQSLAFSQVGLFHFGRVLNTTQASQNATTTTTTAIEGLTTNTKSEPSTSSGSSVESVLNESLAKLAESSKVSVGSPMLLVSQGNTSQPQLLVPDYNTLASFATLLPLHNPITFCTPTLFTLAPQNPFAFVSPTGALHMITTKVNNNEGSCKDKNNDNITKNLDGKNDKLYQETSESRDKEQNVKKNASPKPCHVAPDSTGDPENVSSSGKVQDDDATSDKFSKEDTNDEEKDDLRNERKRFLNKRSFNFYTKNRKSYSNSPVNKRKNLYSMSPMYNKNKSSNSVLKRKDCKIIYESSDTDNHDDEAYNKKNEFDCLNVRKNEKLRQDYSDINYVRKKSFPTLRKKLHVFRKDKEDFEVFNENEIMRKGRRMKRRRKRNSTIDDMDFKKEERHLDGNLYPRRVLRKRSKQVFKGFFFKYKLRHNARLHHCCYGEKGCAMRDADKDASNEISFCSSCDNKKINLKDDLKSDVFEKVCATSDCMVSTTNNNSLNNLSNGSKSNEIKKVKNCLDKKSKNVSFPSPGLIDTTSTTLKHSSMQSPIYSSTSTNTLPSNTDDHSIQSKRISSNHSKLPDEDRPASTTSSDDTIGYLFDCFFVFHF